MREFFAFSHVLLARVELFFIILGSILFAGVVTLTIVLVHYFRRKEKVKKTIHKNEGNNLVFTINLSDYSVRKYDFYNLKDAHLSSLTKFLELFPFSDRAFIRSFFEDAVKRDYNLQDPNNVMVSEFVVEHDKMFKRFIYSKALLEIVGINKEKQIINLSMTLLKNIPTKHEKDKTDSFHKFLYEDLEVATAYSVQDSTKGAIINIKFFKKKKSLNEVQETALKYLLLNCLYEILNEKNSYNYCWMDNEDAHSLFCLTKRVTNIYAVIGFVNKIFPLIERFAEVQGLNNSYHFVVTGASRANLPNDFEKAKGVLREFTQSIYEGGKSYATLSDETAPGIADDTLENDLNRVIKNSLVNVRFFPIYKVTNKRVMTLGYFVNPYIKNSRFISVENFKAVAAKYNLTKEIESLIARKSVPTFNSEKMSNSNKLVIYVTDKEVQYISRIYAHLNNIENTHIIFVFRNSVITQKEKEPTFFQTINTIASRLSCEFYIDINVDDYILKDATYKLFDGFVLNYKTTNGIKFESRDFIKVRNLCEKFLEFKKPIIAANMNSWQEVEMLSRTGITTFASSVISEENANLVPISVKSQRKLLNLYKNN